MAVNKNVAKANKSAASEKGFIQYFKDLKAEFKRITWASKENVKKSTTVVIAFCAIYAVYIGLLDSAFNELMKLILE
jgi:preprotein translocase subunit SecE